MMIFVVSANAGGDCEIAAITNTVAMTDLAAFSFLIIAFSYSTLVRFAAVGGDVEEAAHRPGEIATFAKRQQATYISQMLNVPSPRPVLR